MSMHPDLSGLDADDAATAAAVLAAFGDVTLGRPSPATAARADEETAAALLAAFDAVTLDRPAPGTSPAQASLVALPSRRRGRRLPWLAGAAAAVVVLTAALSLAPGRTSVAWASEPSRATASDTLAAQEACSAPLARGLGDLQESGSAGAGGATLPPATAPAADAGPPTQLPPLAVLDVRGEGALAVYQDATWQVVCLLKREGGRWIDQGISVGPGPSATTPGLLFSGGTTWIGGGSVSYLGGSVPTGTADVQFALDDGSTVHASVLGTTFAAWFPGTASPVPGSLAAYDATGAKLD